MIDTHAHLDALDEPDGAVLATGAGRRRRADRHDRHRDRLVPRARSRSRRAPRGCLRGTRHRPAPGGDPEASRSTSSRQLLGHPTRRRGRRDRARLLPRLRDLRDAAASSSTAQLALAAELGMPVVVHTPRGERRHGGGARSTSTGRSSCTASPSPTLLEPALERGYYVSFAGNVTYPKAAALRDAAARGPGGPDPRRDGQPVPRAAARARPAERAGERPPHARRARGRARRGRRTSWRRGSTRTRPRRSGSSAMSRFAPKRSLGQHFLVDQNMLGVIERLAELEPERRRARGRPGARRPHDVLADRVRARPRVELDRSLEPHSGMRSARVPTSSSSSATRSRSTSPRSHRRRRSSSRTCRTTSRRRSSPRA